MCGIAGFFSYGPDEIIQEDNYSEFVAPLKFRGPDDHGDWHYHSDRARVSFFHTRLSIIDLNPSGHQPMTTEDGMVAIVFNGEIYNYKILRNELINKGCRFSSSSDTEVLLQGYCLWGLSGLLNKIDGMFALALFDKRQNSLFLARDRFGKKPLYYYIRDKQLVFSSDIRSFKAIKSVTFDIDFHALGYFFSEFGTPQENTIWTQIKKVKPACTIQFDNSGCKGNKVYWQLVYTESCKLNRNSIIDKTDFLISNAVKKRLVADVNVSALLSGGIDSSLIVAKMAEHNPGRVKTYSVGFKERNFNELPFARQVADRFNTDHTELVVESQSLEGMDQLILEYGEPFADSSMIPSYLMSKEISMNEKVVLGGDGGDELFGGYDSYYFAYKLDLVKSLGWLYPLTKFLTHSFRFYRLDFLNRLLKQSQFPPYTLLNRNFAFNSGHLKELINNEIFYNSLDKEHQLIWKEYTPHSKKNLINVMSGSLRTRLLNDYLVKVDRASMYASLEMRSPFLDKDLAEFAATLKSDQIFYQSEPKSILKEIALKYFTPDFVYRNKMGFGIPIGNWFRDELTHRLKEVVLGGKQKIVELNYDFVEKLIKEHTRGTVDHSDKLWTLYVFHVWANNQ